MKTKIRFNNTLLHVSDIGTWHSVVELNFGTNQIQKLPDDIACLSNLEVSETKFMVLCQQNNLNLFPFIRFWYCPIIYCGSSRVILDNFRSSESWIWKRTSWISFRMRLDDSESFKSWFSNPIISHNFPEPLGKKIYSFLVSDFLDAFFQFNPTDNCPNWSTCQSVKISSRCCPKRSDLWSRWSRSTSTTIHTSNHFPSSWHSAPNWRSCPLRIAL